MKVLYISMENFDEESIASNGVTKKILGQISAMTEMGIKVDYIGKIKSEFFLFSGGEKQFLCSSLGSGYMDYNRLAKIVYSLIDTNAWDILYVRYVGTDWNANRLYKKCNQNKIKIFLEIPTYPYKKEMCKTIKGTIRFIINEFFNLQLKNYITSMITYTDFDTIHGVQAIRIENGIDTTNIPITKNSSEGVLRLVAMGNLAWWQGYDRLLEGLAAYYRSDSVAKIVYVEIIGEGPEVEKYRKIVKENNLYDYVTFHGKKGATELDEILSHVNVGINSLGCHRKGLTEASTLKSKEFLARGLPIVYSTRENGYSEEQYFCKKVVEDDSPIDIKDIVSFHNKVIEHKGYSKEIRDYADQNISWKVQLKKVFKNLME